MTPQPLVQRFRCRTECRHGCKRYLLKQDVTHSKILNDDDRLELHLIQCPVILDENWKYLVKTSV